MGNTVSPARPHFVLIRPGALGDALLTVPALALLRRQRPEARITLITRRDVLALVTASDLADDVFPHDLPAWTAFFAAKPGAADPLVREVLAGATTVAWMADDDGSIAANLHSLGAAQAVLAPAKPRADQPMHMGLQLAAALRPFDVSVPTTREELALVLPALAVQEADQAAAREVWRGLALSDDQAVIALHPGSGGAAKRWSYEGYAALAGEIHSHGLQPLLIEGPQDREVCAAVQRLSPHPVRAAGELSVSGLAALLQRCTAFVGNDSGVSHLSGLLGVPTLALFGPTDPAIWSPIGRCVRVLRAPGASLEHVSTNMVAAVLRELLARTAHC